MKEKTGQSGIKKGFSFPKLFAFAGLWLFIHTFSWGQSNAAAAQIDSLLRAAQQNGIFNGVALVADAGEIIVHQAYGLADREHTKPLSLEDRFCIGSITKQFTAVLILQMQEKGMLSIHDSLAKYLPEFSDSLYREVTLHHLLTHSSGFPNYTSSPAFQASQDYTEPEMLAWIKTPLLAPPGQKWMYSNSNYYLLGKVAERVSHKDFGELLESYIFGPLGMKNSDYSEDWPMKSVANGHWRTVEGIAEMPRYSRQTLFASGGIFSTAGDLFKWDRALYGTQLLNEKSKAILFGPVLSDYACGFYVKKGLDPAGEYFERHFHGGMIKGYHAFLLRRIPQEQTVILLDNHYNREIPTLKNRIWSALIDEDIRPIKASLSNLLFEACAQDRLQPLLDSIQRNLPKFQTLYRVEEYDINTVGYRLMEADRLREAEVLLTFNRDLYPESWNVYDSLGELKWRQSRRKQAIKLYRRSLQLNPANVSAIEALEKLSAKQPFSH